MTSWGVKEWIFIGVILALLVAAFFVGKGCGDKRENVIVETTSPVQDSLMKAMELLNEIKGKLDSASSPNQTINNITNEIKKYENYPPVAVDTINIKLADSLRAKYKRYHFSVTQDK